VARAEHIGIPARLIGHTIEHVLPPVVVRSAVWASATTNIVIAMAIATAVRRSSATECARLEARGTAERDRPYALSSQAWRFLSTSRFNVVADFEIVGSSERER
jgi:hypothetical protein